MEHGLPMAKLLGVKMFFLRRSNYFFCAPCHVAIVPKDKNDLSHTGQNARIRGSIFDDDPG